TRHPAAPAKRIIGPIAAGGDAEGQQDPRRKHPWPHRPGDCRADIATDQPSDSQAEGDRKADIAEVKGRRMEASRSKGWEATAKKAKKPSASAAWAPSAAPRVFSSRRRSNMATTAPASASTVTHSSIEPS